MQYTLYVDESGDFGHGNKDGEDWVVGGVLCPSEPSIAEKKIGNRLNPIPSQYGLEGRNQLHRTELNQRANSHSSEWDFEQIGNLTRSLFMAVLDAAPNSQFVAVRNPSQRGLDDAEETYRLMVIDLIAVADSILPADESIDRLNIRAATRTGEEGQMTTETQLGARLEKLVGTIEVDLASRGLIGLLSEDDLILQQQNTSWLLTVADFWCNSVYNLDRPESGAAVNAILDQGAGRIFTTWTDDVRVRRALVAERDGNYGLALYRWSILIISSSDDHNQLEVMTRLCHQIITSAQRSPRPTFEQIIEMLWCQFGEEERYSDLLAALRGLENALETAADEANNLTCSVGAVLFRFRNMIHLAANRDGLTEIALKIADQQKEAASQIGYDPDNFSLILDSQLLHIHSLHHALDFDTGLREAEKHRDQVQMYGDLWDLLDENELNFEGSRMNLKSEMTWVESKVYSADPDDSLSEVLTRIEALKDISMAEYDRSRLLNHSILARLRRGWWAGALDESLNALSESGDQYTLAYAARAAATSVLISKVDHRHRTEEIHGIVQERLYGDQTGAFYGLAHRDLSLIEHVLNEDNPAARTALRQGRKALTWSPQSSRTLIRDWVSWTFDLTGRFLSKENEMQIEIPSAFRDTLLDVSVLKGRDGLLRARRVSPY